MNYRALLAATTLLVLIGGCRGGPPPAVSAPSAEAPEATETPRPVAQPTSTPTAEPTVVPSPTPTPTRALPFVPMDAIYDYSASLPRSNISRAGLVAAIVPGAWPLNALEVRNLTTGRLPIRISQPYGFRLDTWELIDVGYLVLSDDGRRLFANGEMHRLRDGIETLIIEEYEGIQLRWDLTGPRLTAGEFHRHDVVSPDGSHYAFITDGGISLVNTWSQSILATFPYPSTEWVVLGQKLMVVVTAEGHVDVWDLQTRGQVGSIRGDDRIRLVQLALGERAVVTADRGGQLRLWHVEGQTIEEIGHHPDLAPEGISVSPDGRSLASLDRDRELRIWDLTGMQPPRAYALAAGLSQIVWLDDGITIAGQTDESALLQVFRVPATAVGSAGFRPIDGHNAGRASVWSLLDLDGEASRLAISPDGRRLAVGRPDGAVDLYDLSGPSAPAALARHQGAATALVFSPDGQSVVLAGGDGRLLILDLATGQVITELKGHQGGVTDVAIDTTGKWLASASMDATVRLWDRETGLPAGILSGHSGPVHDIAFNPKGNLLGSAGSDGRLIVWDVGKREKMQEFTSGAGALTSLAFSPVSQTAIAGSSAGSLLRWNLLKDTMIGEFGFSSRQGSFHGLEFTTDGTVVLSVGAGRTAQLIDVVSGAILKQLSFRDTLVDMDVSRDGRLFLVLSEDGFVYQIGIR